MKKAEKRKILESYNEFCAWMRDAKHFFPNLPKWFNDMADPRNQSYITYSTATLILMCIMKNVTGVGTMRAMNDKFSSVEAIQNLAFLCNERLHEMPDWQTANNFLERLDPNELDDIRVKMINSLIRRKQFYESRESKCWRIILDGTGIAYFKKRHCEHDLVQKHKDSETGEETILYFHKVVEAKIILDEKLVLSIGTEFIENESADVDKQDCETRAAKRLLRRIKKQFPRLPVIVQGDGLYATIPMMELCAELNWHYMVTLKEGSQPTLAKEFENVTSMKDFTNRYDVSYRDEQGKARFVNQLEIGKEKRGVKCNVFQYDTKDTCFTWVTDLEINEKNIQSFVATGRGRWLIENKGFNAQKNGFLNIEHLSSRNGTAMKNHYLIAQISDILMQLYLAFDKIVCQLKRSVKEIVSKILERFTHISISKEQQMDIHRKTTMRLQL